MSSPASESPGVVLRRRLVARPYLVQSRECLLVERHLERAEGRVELLQGARPDDRPGHSVLREQPCQRHVRRVLADVVTEILVALDLVSLRLELLFRPALLPPHSFGFL